MNKKILLIAMAVLCALPTLVSADYREMLEGFLDFLGKPSEVIFNLSPKKIYDGCWKFKFSKITGVDWCFYYSKSDTKKNGKWADVWQGKAVRAATTVALFAFLAYLATSNKTVKEKTQATMEKLKKFRAQKKDGQKIVQEHTRKWEQELNAEEEPA